MLTFGIDPGLTGAMSVFRHGTLVAIVDLPTMEIPGIGPNTLVRNKLNARALVEMVREFCPAGEVAQAVIEAVQAMGGTNNAVQTQGALLRCLGSIESVLECCRIPVTYANPQRWKGFYGLIDREATPAERKEAARQCALRMWPDRLELQRKKDHNRAEAALIGNWLVRTTE